VCYLPGSSMSLRMSRRRSHPRRRGCVGGRRPQPLAWIDSSRSKKPARAHAGEAMGETDIPTKQPQAGQAPRVPSSDVDAGRPVDSLRPPTQGPGQAVGLIWSVRDRATFQALRRSRARVRRGPVTVTWVPGDPSEPPRVAYAVGRSAGGAVVRNRLRRRLRAVSREAGPLLRPGAYLVGATAGASSLSYRELRTTVCEALATLATKQVASPVTRQRPPPPTDPSGPSTTASPGATPVPDRPSVVPPPAPGEPL
jgi:ribonuclease P protein component